MTTHKERIQACIQGEVIDHPPVALWRHFPVDDQTPGTLAKAALQQAGYKSAIAARAVERATARLPPNATLEVLLKEAFRHCL